jgi:hypothetical protein
VLDGVDLLGSGISVLDLRLFALSGNSNRQQIAHFFDAPIALLLLDTAATITVALAPPRTQRDFACRERGSNPRPPA